LKYRWKFRQKPDEKDIQKLASLLKIPKSLAKILVVRGLTEKSDIDKFFQPEQDDIHDPFLMDGMHEAVDRVLEAVKKKELIWIHGDYDVDGTSSTAMIYEFIRDIGGNVMYYIPDRFHEGYGLSKSSINKADALNAKLLITVDVGITSFEPLAHAREKGIFSIVCDHHEPGDELPNANIILDPLKKNCPYPFKHLSACGVTFKLVQAISQKMGTEEKSFKYLDLVAVASAADMVPLIGENRTLAHLGLRTLNSAPRPGFKGLMYCTGLKPGTITTSSIVYSLAPLINAAGRLGDASRSVEMMIQKDEIEAFRIAQQLEHENRRRRAFDEKTFEEAGPMAEKILKTKPYKSLVLHKANWHAGVIGIVASRLVDRFNLPTVLLTTIDGTAKGSARSISSFDIHNALKSCSEYLIEFGGHKHAAGLSMEEKHIPAFREAFNEIAQHALSNEMLVPEIVIDSELKLNELSPNFMHILSRFAPYGFENNKPVFYSKGVVSSNGLKIVGNNHLKFRAMQHHFVIDAIGYNLAHKIELCTDGKPFSIVYNLEETVFNGYNTIQLKIKDIRPDLLPGEEIE
jgi:single-stranded-DNA-specific exonuclease